MKPRLRVAFAMTIAGLALMATWGCLDAQSPPAGYKLVWSDDFSRDPDGQPDPTKWGYEEGFVRNNESQYYTKARLENARVEKGRLVIEARKEEYVYDDSLDHLSQPAHYTSAAL